MNRLAVILEIIPIRNRFSFFVVNGDFIILQKSYSGEILYAFNSEQIIKKIIINRRNLYFIKKR